jgi:hypothetical protein
MTCKTNQDEAEKSQKKKKKPATGFAEAQSKSRVDLCHHCIDPPAGRPALEFFNVQTGTGSV